MYNCFVGFCFTRKYLSFITIIILISIIINQVQKASALLCYSCVSTQPGCTLEQVNWLIYSAISCPEPDDKCVKIIEQHGVEYRVTRDCLSNIMSLRDDVPADRFEGCRPASEHPKRAVFVDNSISELDLKKSNHFTNTTYCFCEFDQWCNSSPGFYRPQNMALILTTIVSTITLSLIHFL